MELKSKDTYLLRFFQHTGEDWVVIAFRYYLGRQTGSTRSFILGLEECILELEGWQRHQIKRDILQKIHIEDAFYNDWMRVADKIKRNQLYCDECGMIYYNCLCSHEDDENC